MKRSMTRSLTQTISLPSTPLATAKRKEYRLRSDRVYYSRLFTAWAINWGLYTALVILCIGYAGRFGEELVNDMLLSWAKSLGFVFGILEPLNVMIIVALPMIAGEDSCIYRTYERIYYVYNEFLA